jgi:hypothetical protein
MDRSLRGRRLERGPTLALAATCFALLLAIIAPHALADGPFTYTDNFCNRLVGANSSDTCSPGVQHHYGEIWGGYSGAGTVNKCGGGFVPYAGYWTFEACSDGTAISCYYASCAVQTVVLVVEGAVNRSANNHTIWGEGWA